MSKRRIKSPEPIGTHRESRVDGPEQVAKCLDCPWAECWNCVQAHYEAKRPRWPHILRADYEALKQEQEQKKERVKQ